MADDNNNTGIQFEDIVPWVNDSGDTGLTSRLKLKRNFDKIKAWMDANHIDAETVKKILEEQGADLFLSKINDDEAHGEMGFLKGIWIGLKQWYIDIFGNAKFNELTVGSDATIGGVTHANDIQSDNYTGDGMFDTGGMWQYLNGKAKIVVDSIVCRGKFIVNEIEDRIWTYAGGNLIFSAAGSTIFYVEYLDASGQALGYTIINSPWLAKFSPLLSGVIAWSKRRQVQRQLTPEERVNVAKFRCYQLSDDGTMQTRNWWHLDDIALCQTLNRVKNKVATSGSYSGSLSNTVYARRVVGIGSKKISIINDNKIYDYVDLSATDYDISLGNDWPAAGDVIVQRGNFTDNERQGFSTVEVTGAQRGFKVYDDVSGYSMEGKKKAFLGYDADRKVAQLDVFGDAYIGAMGTTDPREGSTYVKFNSKTGELIIKAKIDASSTISNKDIDTYVNGLITDITDVIEQQVDKKAETWYQSTNPAQQQGWVASEHVGDMWYCTADIAGTNFKQDTTWRYNSSYQWEQQFIPKTVFDTMDGKASIFVSKPNTIRNDGYCYKKNDMWILEAAYTLSDVAYKAGTIVVATTDSTTWNANHWVKKDMYTDDSAFLGWKADGYASDITGLTNSISSTDGRARSAQSAASAAQTAADNAQSTANTANTNANTANTRLTNWADNGLISPTEKTGLKGQKADIEAEYTQIIADANRYSVGTTVYTTAYNSAITAFNKYTASTPENITVESDYSNISAYYTARQVILNAIAAAAKQYAYDCAKTVNDAHEYLRNALSGKTEIDGGLMMTTFISLRKYNSGDASDPANYTTYGGLNGVYENADTIAAWFGGMMRDIVRNPSLTNGATSLFRMDGSGYFAAGKIKWEANGSLEIDGKVTSKEGTIGGFDIGDKTLGTKRDSGTVGGTYIRKDGYMRIYNVDNRPGLSVIGGFELLGNGIYAVIDNIAGTMYQRAQTLNINTDANPNNNVNIGGVNTQSVNINAEAANFGSSTPVNVGNALAVAGLLSAGGNIKTSSFTIPISSTVAPKIGEFYFCKGVSGDIIVNIRSGYKLLSPSDNGERTGSVNIGTRSDIILYIGDNKWVEFWCG